MPAALSYVRRCAFVAGLAFLGPESASAQAGLARESPFTPAGNAGPAAGPAETLEFAGVSTVGQKTDLIILDKSTKKRRWIALGATVDGIAALKYDARLEQAVVRFHGVEKVLTLKKSSGPLNAPTAVPSIGFPANRTPPAGLPPPIAPGPSPAAAAANPNDATAQGTIAREESEARMLVSDLLQIGQLQRKAYEEARAKEAATRGTPAADPTAPPAGK